MSGTDFGKVHTDEPLSLFEILGPHSSTCGYCTPPGSSKRSKTKSSKSFGVWAHQMSCKEYKLLIDRGWRRSGAYVYKPDMRSTCCNQYTIRLDSSAFKPSKSQRSILNRFNTFIEEGGREGQLGYGPARAAPSQPRAVHGKVKGKASKNAIFDLTEVLHRAEGKRDAAHLFEVSMEAATFTEEKFELYKKYQVQIHGDKASDLKERSFRRFLCDSPLSMEASPVASQPYGSFHQMYRIDGQLVAIGVIDILPGAVSGVYLVYDPDWSALSLGKVSALRECALAVELEKAGFERMYYMMGYYIHNCQKMKYKAEYSPSQLLDPETYEWLPFAEVCKPLLDRDSHVIFSGHKGGGMPASGGAAGVDANPASEMAVDVATSPEAAVSEKDAKDAAGMENEDEDEEEEGDEEDEEEEHLCNPPPPGFLDPAALPTDLLRRVYMLERSRVVPLLLSSSWRTNADSQRRLREGIAAMGEAAQDVCLFVS